MKKLIIILICFSVWSCSEEKLKLYDGKNAVYFYKRGGGDKVVNEQHFGFGGSPEEEHEIEIPVKCTGDIYNTDRYFAVEYDSIIGREGEQFAPLPDKFVFPANSDIAYVKIKLYKQSEENDTLYQIKIRLVENEEFTTQLPYYFNSGRDTMDILNYKLTFDSQFTPPPGWNVTYFGYFSINKYYELNRLTGLTLGYQLPATDAIAVGNAFNNHISKQMRLGPESALKDPRNKYPEDKGYMTLRGRTESPAFMEIPDDWEPATFNDNL